MSVTDTAEISHRESPSFGDRREGNPFETTYMLYLKKDVRQLAILDEGKPRFRGPTIEAQSNFIESVLDACESNISIPELLPGPYVIAKARELNRIPDNDEVFEKAEIRSAHARLELLDDALNEDRTRIKVNATIRAAVRHAVESSRYEPSKDTHIGEVDAERVKKLLQANGLPPDITEIPDNTGEFTSRAIQRKDIQHCFDAIGVHDPTIEDPRKVLSSNDTIFYMQRK